MPRETREREIDGVTYKVTQFGGDTARKAIVRGALSLTVQNLTEENLLWLHGEFAKNTEVGIKDTAGDGRVTFVKLSEHYDSHFEGGPASHARMLKWTMFAWEVNFGPLVDAVPAMVRGLRAVFPLSFQKARTGSSGGSSSQAA